MPPFDALSRPLLRTVVRLGRIAAPPRPARPHLLALWREAQRLAFPSSIPPTAVSDPSARACFRLLVARDTEAEILRLLELEVYPALQAKAEQQIALGSWPTGTVAEDAIQGALELVREGFRRGSREFRSLAELKSYSRGALGAHRSRTWKKSERRPRVDSIAEGTGEPARDEAASPSRVFRRWMQDDLAVLEGLLSDEATKAIPRQVLQASLSFFACMLSSPDLSGLRAWRSPAREAPDWFRDLHALHRSRTASSLRASIEGALLEGELERLPRPELIAPWIALELGPKNLRNWQRNTEAARIAYESRCRAQRFATWKLPQPKTARRGQHQAGGVESVQSIVTMYLYAAERSFARARREKENEGNSHD